MAAWHGSQADADAPMAAWHGPQADADAPARTRASGGSAIHAPMLQRRRGRLAGACAAILVALLCAWGVARAPATAPAATRADAGSGSTPVAAATRLGGTRATAPEPGVRAAARTLRALGRALPIVGGQFIPPQPNIVFVLTDDLSWDLIPYMPHVRELQRRGTTFSNYFVTDSLCCPSRASILTGQFPHDTGIYRNSGPDGGFLAFQARGEEQTTYATTLQGAGYRTALMGKYLNQYGPRVRNALGGVYVPPGWSDWDVAGNGYPGFGYAITRGTQVVRHGYRPQDYLTNVLAQRGASFVDQAVAAGGPFMLNLWTFAPHAPATPAPSDANRFPNLTAPRDPSFDEADMSDKPAWIASHPALTAGQLARIDDTFRQRVRAVQAVDRMVGRLERRLRADGVANNTYIVFSSDNGFHAGQHRLTPGKLTAYDPDVRVPLIVAGPGVAAGRTSDAMTQNTDLCPTFAELAGTPPPPHADGRSLVGLLRGDARSAAGWRDAVLIEHKGDVNTAGDPDLPPAGSGNPPTYEALRSKDTLYVEYADGERELYDLSSDPFELHNLAGTAPPERLARLSAALAGMQGCHGEAACRSAQQLG
jgi:N-acetylglucosamine-6-sulfatase